MEGGGTVRYKCNNIFQFIFKRVYSSSFVHSPIRICGGCITKAFIMISRVHKVKRMNRVRVTSVYIYFVNLALDCYTDEINII